MAGYGDDAGLTAWLADNGLTLPGDAPASAVLRQRGSAYVDSTYGDRLRCSDRTGGAEQERAWPRVGHPNVASDVVPIAWVHASYRAAYLTATVAGGLSQQINPNNRVIRQKVDVIERQFADNGPVTLGQAAGVIDPEIDGMVSPYLCSKTAILGIRSIGT